MADPVEGTLWWIDDYVITWALADKPFLKKVAEEWLNKMLSPEFQRLNLVEASGQYPVITNFTDKLEEEERIRAKTRLASIRGARDLKFPC